MTPERSVELSLRHARLRVGVENKRIVTTLRLATKKPWAIDVAYFTPARRPLYLTGMAVSVVHQRQGLGRAALDDARAIAAAWPADAIRLDAFDAPAGAGAFYERCGYEQRARVVYKDDALIYFELVLR
jgi:GNAT superfamily N-acetyltransferase